MLIAHCKRPDKLTMTNKLVRSNSLKKKKKLEFTYRGYIIYCAF